MREFYDLLLIWNVINFVKGFKRVLHSNIIMNIKLFLRKLIFEIEHEWTYANHDSHVANENLRTLIINVKQQHWL